MWSLLLFVTWLVNSLSQTVTLDWENPISHGNVDVTTGTTVVWEWTDGAPHNVISTNDAGNTFPGDDTIVTGAGNTYSFTFNAAGSFSYICGVHPNTMDGTIVVSAPTPEPVPQPQPVEAPQEPQPQPQPAAQPQPQPQPAADPEPQPQPVEAPTQPTEGRRDRKPKTTKKPETTKKRRDSTRKDSSRRDDTRRDDSRRDDSRRDDGGRGNGGRGNGGRNGGRNRV